MTPDHPVADARSGTVSVLVRSMARPTLHHTLASVATQRADDVEVIVVNASGTEHPPLGNRCGPFELRLHEPGRPLERATAANAALALARGRWAIFLDDDDSFDADHLARLRAALDRDRGAGAAYAGVRLVSADGQPCGILDEPFDLVRLCSENFLPIHAVMFDRLAAGEAPWFDESLSVYEDWDFWLRLAQRLRFVHVAGVSATYHVQGKSGLTHEPDAQVTQAGRLAVFTKWAPRMPGPLLESLATRAAVGRVKVRELDEERRRLDQQQAALSKELEQATGALQVLQQGEHRIRLAWGDSQRLAQEALTRAQDGQARADQAQARADEAQSRAQEAQGRWQEIQALVRETERQLRDALSGHAELQAALDVARGREATLLAELQEARAAHREHDAQARKHCHTLQVELDLVRSRETGLRTELRAADERHRQFVAQADGQVQTLQGELAATVRNYRHLEAGYRQVTSSLTWRMAAPLRLVRTALSPSRLHAGARSAVRSTLRSLPVSATFKQRIKVWMVARPWAARWLPWFALSSSIATVSPTAATLSAVAPRSPDTTVPANGRLDKEAVRADAEAQLDVFLRRGGRIDLTSGSKSPEVSVIVVLYNQAGLSLLCLRSLMASRGVSFETLIVDNASSDRMPELLKRLDGATVLRQSSNIGFLRAVNLASTHARGEHLLLLNNDALVEPDTLQLAVQRLAREPDVGAVGGPILLWDGRLQEAGSIIWSDGSCLGYGRGDDPEAPAYRFVRDVDYCSGAFLMVRRALFESLGRFDEVFAPAYYEESDFCVRLWERGQRIVFDPAVRVRHFEFASEEGSGRAIELQTRNRARFVARHPGFLARRPEPAPDQILRGRQRMALNGRRVLVIDDRVPLAWLGQGYPRAARMVEVMVDAGHFVTHYPLQFPHEPRELVSRALPERVEVMVDRGLSGFAGFLAERQGYYDVVIVSRPHNMEILTAVTAGHPEWLGDARVVYDAEALFSLRDIAKAEVMGQALDTAEQQRLIDGEMALARGAHAIVTVSRLEAQHYEAAGYGDVYVLGHAMKPVPTAAPFSSRSGFLFVGALMADDTPNADSLLWFAAEIWPRLVARLGDAVVLHIVGPCEAPAVRALASRSIVIHGAVTDLAPHFDGARVFVVPTRYAAGIAHKAHEAAAHGLPMVTTALIASQLGWDQVVSVGRDADSFVDACMALHSDESLWRRQRARCLQALERDCSVDDFGATVLAIVQSHSAPQAELRTRRAMLEESTAAERTVREVGSVE